jgi:hypothetical protein
VATIDLLEELLSEIEEIIGTTSLDCEISKYQVTPGRPAAPTGQNCNVVSVWSPGAFNGVTELFHEDDPCVIRRGVELRWRLDLCFTETERDRTSAEQLAISTCIYGYGDAIWCGIAKRIGEKLWGDCTAVAIDPLIVAEPLGAIVSVESGFRVHLDCEPEPTS